MDEHTQSVGDTPLSDVTDRIDAEHGAGQFGAAEDAQIVCFTCHRRFAASGVSADEMTRVEGASDPADMAMVVPVTCPNCSATGSLVLSYGPDSSAEDADVISAMERTATATTPGLT